MGLCSQESKVFGFDSQTLGESTQLSVLLCIKISLSGRIQPDLYFLNESKELLVKIQPLEGL